jgi:hypothetical protein
LEVVLLFLAAVLVSVACTTSEAARIPPQAVIVFEKDATPPAGCSRIGTVKARDGYTGSAWDFKDGSRARVLERLRRSAAAKGGTAVVIREEGGVLCLHCYGSVVEIEGDVLKCV